MLRPSHQASGGFSLSVTQHTFPPYRWSPIATKLCRLRARLRHGEQGGMRIAASHSRSEMGDSQRPPGRLQGKEDDRTSMVKNECPHSARTTYANQLKTDRRPWPVRLVVSAFSCHTKVVGSNPVRAQASSKWNSISKWNSNSMSLSLSLPVSRGAGSGCHSDGSPSLKKLIVDLSIKKLKPIKHVE